MLSRVWLFVTPCTVAHQDPLSMGILQARILEWVAMPSSRGSSQPRDQTQVPHCRRILYHLSHQGSPRILEWVAYPFSRGTSQPRNWTRVLCIADSSTKKQRHCFTDKGPSGQIYGFSSSPVWIWELDYKKSWALKKWCFWTVLLEKTLWESIGQQGDPTSQS